MPLLLLRLAIVFWTRLFDDVRSARTTQPAAAALNGVELACVVLCCVCVCWQWFFAPSCLRPQALGGLVSACKLASAVQMCTPWVSACASVRHRKQAVVPRCPAPLGVLGLLRLGPCCLFGFHPALLLRRVLSGYSAVPGAAWKPHSVGTHMALNGSPTARPPSSFCLRLLPLLTVGVNCILRLHSADRQ